MRGIACKQSDKSFKSKVKLQEVLGVSQGCYSADSKDRPYGCGLLGLPHVPLKRYVHIQIDTTVCSLNLTYQSQKFNIFLIISFS